MTSIVESVVDLLMIEIHRLWHPFNPKHSSGLKSH